MRLEDFDFDLPEALIATRPVRPRSSARLLVVDGAALADRVVADLPRLLRPGDRLVMNDTKVLPVRLTGERRRPAGGQSSPGAGRARIEATLLEHEARGVWRALVKPLRKLAEGETVSFGGGFDATYLGRGADGLARLDLALEGAALEAALETAGAMPLPPYIAARRPADARDREDYQSVFAIRPGAVAAPTASLHFDAPLIAALAARGVSISFVTLHVGAGTFLPVTQADPRAHRMHAEWGEIGADAAAEIVATRAAGGRIVAVGTTALRLIETAARDGGAVAPWSGETDIFIYPGFHFRAADALITNFHLPKSTLMMLVAAFVGTERVLAAYAHAVRRGYRFFSYGDATLLIPAGRGQG